MYYRFLHQSFHRFLPFQHLSLSPAITTGSSEDLLSDALISLDVNCSPSRSCDASGLLPYVSLFEGTSSDLELDTEDEHRVTPPDSYQNNNAPQSLDHLTNAAKLSDQDLYDDNYGLAEDEVVSLGAFGPCPSSCLPEAPDGGWHCRGWSPDSLFYQDYDQALGKVSSSGAYSLSQPLKMPTSMSRSGSPGLFSDSGQPVCEYGGVITDDDFDIEYDFDVKA